MASKGKALKKGVIPDNYEQIHLDCDCGNGGMVKVRHWEKVRCVCGRIWWALRTKRNRPLVLFGWPGNGLVPTGWERQ